MADGLDDLVRNLGNPQPALRLMGDRLLDWTETRFNQENTPAGNPWPPLDPDYKETKANTSILTETGQMSGQIGKEVLDDAVVIGGTDPSQKDKMLAHNYGANDSVQVPGHTRTITQAFGEPLDTPMEVQVDPYTMDMNIPQRQFIGASKRYSERLARILLDHYVNK